MEVELASAGKEKEKKKFKRKKTSKPEKLKLPPSAPCHRRLCPTTITKMTTAASRTMASVSASVSAISRIAVRRAELPPGAVRVPSLVNGDFFESAAELWFPVRDPATQDVVAYTPQSTPDELRAAADSAHAAFGLWRRESPVTRQLAMLRLQHLVSEHTDEIARVIVREQGKTLADARGDVYRGLRTCPCIHGAVACPAYTVSFARFSQSLHYHRGRSACRVDSYLANGRAPARITRNGHVLDQSASGRNRRNLPVQLPRNDPAMGFPFGCSLRQCNDSQTV